MTNPQITLTLRKGSKPYTFEVTDDLWAAQASGGGTAITFKSTGVVVNVKEPLSQVNELICEAKHAVFAKEFDSGAPSSSPLTINHTAQIVPSRSRKEWRKHVANELSNAPDNHVVSIQLGDLRNLLKVRDSVPAAIYLTKVKETSKGAKIKGDRQVVVNVPDDTPYMTQVINLADSSHTLFVTEGFSAEVEESPERINAMLSVSRRIRDKVAKRKKAMRKSR